MKPKKCKSCGETFTPERPFQKCCKYSCAIDYVALIKTKSQKAVQKQNNKAKKEFNALDRTKLIKDAQKHFNAYIRTRDGKKCISCRYDGSNAYNGDEYVGRKFDAGHFKSQGGNSALRFDENNCHAQCVQCNQFKSGNLSEYRKKLIKKIGIDEVLRLETTKNTKLWTVEELQEIIVTYKRKIKEIAV